MEDASVQVRRLLELGFHDLMHVRITEHVPTLKHSLPNTLELNEHPNFKDIVYPILDHK